MRRLIRLLPLLGVLLLLGPPEADARKGDKRKGPPTAQEDLDRLVVAAVLLGDGHADRALRILEEVDLEAMRETRDWDDARYHHLLGRARFTLGATEGAIEAFQTAVEAGSENPDTFLYLAQAQQSLGEHEAALASLDGAGEAAWSLPGGFMIAARSLTALERYDEAWDTLQAGRAAFAREVAFDRELLYLLIKLELYQEARVVGDRYLDRRPEEPSAWIAVGESLRQSGNLEEAAAILEAARVRFPDEVDAYTRLARTYQDLGVPGACGSVLQLAAELDPELAGPAAECFRDAGRLEQALYMNSLVPDPVVKARIRLGLLVRAEAWGQAVALLPRLERLGLLEEDPVAYASAYVLFQVGQYDRAEEMLKRIRDARLFKDATTLRKAMADCQANPGSCL